MRRLLRGLIFLLVVAAAAAGVVYWYAGRGEGPKRMLVTLGYAGWSPGQLEHELSQNAWLTVQAADGIIFETPAEERLPAAMELLGLDFARLQDEAGHA